MRKSSVSTFKVAATYIGTIVGAGFATGQEILQFFANFGAWGIVGLFLATLLFAGFGYIVIDLGKLLGARSHQEIIRHSGGKILGTLIDWVIIFFLFGALTTMFAGSGALFAQQFALPAFLGSVAMGALTAFTVLRGIDAVINSISYVVPFLIVSVVAISLSAVLKTPPDFSMVHPGGNQSSLITNWFLSAVLYVSYNLILSIAVLGPLGVKARNQRSVKYGAFLGGLGLGIAALMICLAIVSNYAAVSRLEVPMIYAAGRISPLVQILFALVLIAEVYTTAVSSLYGFATRLVDVEKSSASTKRFILVTTAAALLASQFGFSNLVKYLYPLVGYAGLVLLVCLLVSKIRGKAWAK